jgi:hypothetical protein
MAKTTVKQPFKEYSPKEIQEKQKEIERQAKETYLNKEYAFPITFHSLRENINYPLEGDVVVEFQNGEYSTTNKRTVMYLRNHQDNGHVFFESLEQKEKAGQEIETRLTKITGGKK